MPKQNSSKVQSVLVSDLQDLFPIEKMIYEIRGRQVMLDRDLAMLYGVETRRLNEQVRRNIERFPEDFMFQLTKDEAIASRSQFATLNNQRGQNIKYLPYAFTENGVAMMSSVLHSPSAIEVNIQIMRAFAAMRRLFYSNAQFFHRLNSSVLTLLDKRAEKVSAMIYTKNISPQLSLDIQRHNAQYAPVKVTEFDKVHDRFLCVDDTVYHIGASLKDLGKKWFAFSKMEITTEQLVSKMQ